jgi:hypothetical protein
MNRRPRRAIQVSSNAVWANFRNGRAIRRERATKTEDSTLLPIYHSPIVPVLYRGGKGEPACLLKSLNLDWASHRVDADRSLVKTISKNSVLGLYGHLKSPRPLQLFVWTISSSTVSFAAGSGSMRLTGTRLRIPW